MTEPTTTRITSPRSKAAKALEEGQISPEDYVAETLAEVRELIRKGSSQLAAPERDDGASDAA